MSLSGPSSGAGEQAFETPAVEASKCARSRDRYNECRRCVDLCPTSAFRLDGSISFDRAACIACGLCMINCPTQALTGQDQVDVLLENVQIVQGTSELACQAHRGLGVGPAPAGSSVHNLPCLAALGPSAFLYLHARGMERIVVRLDACGECERGKCLAGILLSIRIARSIFAARGEPDVLASVESGPQPGWVERKNERRPTTPSRRQFLKSLLFQGARLAVDAALRYTETDVGVTGAMLERRRLLRALAMRPAITEGAIELSADMPFANFYADSSCSACGLCARICPTAALQMESDEHDFRLTFDPSACTNCGMCLDLCAPHSLMREATLPLAQLSAAERLVLREGGLSKCKECGTSYASEFGSEMCSFCAFRAEHPYEGKPGALSSPFGSRAR